VLPALDLLGRLVVAVAFGWAAVGKLADLPGLRATLYLSRLTRPWVPQLTVALPGVELVLAVSLLAARAGFVAALGSAALLAAFVAYLALDRAAGQGCNCFGRRSSSTSRTAGIVRDLLLLAALVPALVRGPAADRWGVPAGGEPWWGLAGAVGVAIVFWWAFRRPVPARVRTGSGRRRVGVPTEPPVEPVRRPAPPFDLAALDGGRLALAELAARPGGVLLVFTEPGCALCEVLVGELAGRPDTIYLVGGDPAEVAAWAGAHRLSPSMVAADPDGAVADAYRATAVPAACRVDATGLLVDAAGVPVARPAVGPDAVRALAFPRRDQGV
jgi:uncharacterized membrane protein YphA (DoxX/SURF4 family)